MVICADDRSFFAPCTRCVQPQKGQKNTRQHRTIASVAYGGSFAPILQFENLKYIQYSSVFKLYLGTKSLTEGSCRIARCCLKATISLRNGIETWIWCGRGETTIGTPAAIAPLLRERSILMKKKKFINDTAIPQHVIESIARCLLPDILADFECEGIQREFAEWQKAQNANAQESVSE